VNERLKELLERQVKGELGKECHVGVGECEPVRVSEEERERYVKLGKAMSEPLDLGKVKKELGPEDDLLGVIGCHGVSPPFGTTKKL
jgi:hypothetical protein